MRCSGLAVVCLSLTLLSASAEPAHAGITLDLEAPAAEVLEALAAELGLEVVSVHYYGDEPLPADQIVHLVLDNTRGYDALVKVSQLLGRPVITMHSRLFCLPPGALDFNSIPRVTVGAYDVVAVDVGRVVSVATSLPFWQLNRPEPGARPVPRSSLTVHLTVVPEDRQALQRLGGLLQNGAILVGPDGAQVKEQSAGMQFEQWGTSDPEPRMRLMSGWYFGFNDVPAGWEKATLRSVLGFAGADAPEARLTPDNVGQTVKIGSRVVTLEVLDLAQRSFRLKVTGGEARGLSLTVSLTDAAGTVAASPAWSSAGGPNGTMVTGSWAESQGLAPSVLCVKVRPSPDDWQRLPFELPLPLPPEPSVG